MSIPDTNLPIFFQQYTVTPLLGSGVTVVFSTVSANPSNQALSRVWSFNSQLKVDRPLSTISLLYDFSAVQAQGYNVTFEGSVNGTLTIGKEKEAYNATRYVSYTFDSTQKTVLLTIRLPHTQYSFRQVPPREVWFSFTIDDSSFPPCSKASC